MGFEEVQRGVRKTLPSHFLGEVIKGVLSWSCCPRTRVTASHSMAARPSKFPGDRRVYFRGGCGDLSANG